MKLGNKRESLKIPADIIEGIKNNEIVLFIGAGATTEGNGVFKENLYSSIKKELNIEKDMAFSELMQLYCDKPNGRKKLIKELRRRFQYYEEFPEIKRNMTQFFYHLSSIYSIKDIITTNWDTILERECACVPIIYEEDIALLDENDRKVYKMHGSIENVSTLIMTKDDYTRCYNELNTNLLGSRIKELLANKTVVFIGYSLKDDDFKKIWELINKNLRKLRPHFYIVSPDEKIKDRLKDENVTLIKALASDFIIQVKEKLIEDKFILRREILDDVSYSLRKEIVDRHDETHRLMAENQESLLVYCTSYQDGYIHSLDRMIALENTGLYCSLDYIRSSINDYEELYQEYYDQKNYFDAAYCQGYANGMKVVLSYYKKFVENKHNEIKNYYYFLFNQKSEIKTLDELMEKAKHLKNKEIIQQAEDVLDKAGFKGHKDMVVHHRPFL